MGAIRYQSSLLLASRLGTSGAFFQQHLLSRRAEHTSAGVDSSQIQVQLCTPTQLRPKPLVKDLVFGKTFSDHMLRVKWTATNGWEQPRITPMENFEMHPGAKVLHYAQELFEGMKAFRGVDDKIRMFRPMHNMARMNVTAKRSCLPTFDGREYLECIRKLIQIDQEWVPHSISSSLYIRPTLIGTEAALGVSPATEAELFTILSPVGPYFSTGVNPVNLLADPKFVRAWPGGCGFAKMGSNYAPTLWVAQQAEKFGCQQVLWLFGEDHEITEVGAMNIFICIVNSDGDKELVTPSLDKGIILPGVTRRSIVEMVSEWDNVKMIERNITMDELMKANESGKLIEVFGAGTAAVVSPVGGIHYRGKMNTIPVPEREESLSSRINDAMADIYYGRVNHPWATDIERWDIDPKQQITDYVNAERKMEMA